MTTNKLVGVDPELLLDPEVQEALGKVEKGIDKDACIALTQDPNDRLAKYGIKCRKSGLQHKALIARIMFAFPQATFPRLDAEGQPVIENGKPVMDTTFDVPGISQALFWLYTLAAPMQEVYQTIGLLERSGLEPFVDKVDAWFAKNKLDGEALGEVIQVMGEDIALTNKLNMNANSSSEGSGELPNASCPGL